MLDIARLTRTESASERSEDDVFADRILCPPLDSTNLEARYRDSSCLTSTLSTRISSQLDLLSWKGA